MPEYVREDGKFNRGYRGDPRHYRRPDRPRINLTDVEDRNVVGCQKVEGVGTFWSHLQIGSYLDLSKNGKPQYVPEWVWREVLKGTPERAPLKSGETYERAKGGGDRKKVFYTITAEGAELFIIDFGGGDKRRLTRGEVNTALKECERLTAVRQTYYPDAPADNRNFEPES